MRKTPLATTEQVAELLNVVPGTLRNWRSEGTGPAYIKLGVREIRYDMTEVRAWIKANRVVPVEGERKFTADEWERAQEINTEDCTLSHVIKCEHSVWTMYYMEPGNPDPTAFQCEECLASIKLLEFLELTIRCECGMTFSNTDQDADGDYHYFAHCHWPEAHVDDPDEAPRCPNDVVDCTCTH